jgi:hypothetical protein
MLANKIFDQKVRLRLLAHKSLAAGSGPWGL